MLAPSIASYFPFRRIKIINQSVTAEATEAHIQLQPDKRFQPICHGFGKRAASVHSWTQLKILDLNMAATRLWDLTASIAKCSVLTDRALVSKLWIYFVLIFG